MYIYNSQIVLETAIKLGHTTPSYIFLYFLLHSHHLVYIYIYIYFFASESRVLVAKLVTPAGLQGTFSIWVLVGQPYHEVLCNFGVSVGR